MDDWTIPQYSWDANGKFIGLAPNNSNGIYNGKILPSSINTSASASNTASNTGGGFDFNLDNILQGAQLALNAFNAFQGYKALGLAEDQFNFQKDAWKADYANNIQAYNTSLADILGARAAMETGNKNAYDSLIAERSLKERNIG